MPPSPEPIEIDIHATKAKLDARGAGGEAFLLLDCREKSEWEAARIDGAELFPMSELAQRVGELAPHQAAEVIVHCHHGGRSLRVANWLRQQGFARAKSMAGGIDQWSIAIDPAVPRY